MNRREELLLIVIKNFIRKINSIELNEEVSNGLITENEFEEEIKNNYDKYVIQLKNITDEDAEIIVDLMEKIGLDIRDITTSEVADMFSVKENQLLLHITKNRFIK